MPEQSQINFSISLVKQTSEAFFLNNITDKIGCVQFCCMQSTFLMLTCHKFRSRMNPPSSPLFITDFLKKFRLWYGMISFQLSANLMVFSTNKHRQCFISFEMVFRKRPTNFLYMLYALGQQLRGNICFIFRLTGKFVHVHFVLYFSIVSG